MSEALNSELRPMQRESRLLHALIMDMQIPEAADAGQLRACYRSAEGILWAVRRAPWLPIVKKSRDVGVNLGLQRIPQIDEEKTARFEKVVTLIGAEGTNVGIGIMPMVRNIPFGVTIDGIRIPQPASEMHGVISSLTHPELIERWAAHLPTILENVQIATACEQS
jgi:hypothetical protein